MMIDFKFLNIISGSAAKYRLPRMVTMRRHLLVAADAAFDRFLAILLDFHFAVRSAGCHVQCLRDRFVSRRW